MTATEKNIARNVIQLVKAGIATLQAAGWNDEKIIPHIPYLTDEAFKFLKNK